MAARVSSSKAIVAGVFAACLVVGVLLGLAGWHPASDVGSDGNLRASAVARDVREGERPLKIDTSKFSPDKLVLHGLQGSKHVLLGELSKESLTGLWGPDEEEREQLAKFIGDVNLDSFAAVDDMFSFSFSYDYDW